MGFAVYPHIAGATRPQEKHGMNDNPRAIFESAQDFLGFALELLAQERVLWDHSHQSGHNVSKAEAEQVLYWSRPENLRPHHTAEGRWVTWGLNRKNELVFVAASVTLRADGPYLFLRAWLEERRFGS